MTKQCCDPHEKEVKSEDDVPSEEGNGIAKPGNAWHPLNVAWDQREGVRKVHCVPVVKLIPTGMDDTKTRFLVQANKTCAALTVKVVWPSDTTDTQEIHQWIEGKNQGHHPCLANFNNKKMRKKH